MIKKLEIKNYALIQNVELEFDNGLTIITGETGAGKSILLGGLSLILGNRAQQGLLNNPQKKSIVEGTFDIQNYHLKKFFQTNDLDYEDESIIRRELLPGGKSRAFINDSPVRLESLSKLSEKLIDIHSQHKTLELNDKNFQFDLIDAIAKNESKINIYQKSFSRYKDLKKEEKFLIDKLENAQEELEYKNFQLQELNEIALENINFEEIEQKLKQLEHAEEIREILSESFQKINDDEQGIHNRIIEIRNAFRKIEKLSPIFSDLTERLESMQIEIADISNEIEESIEQNDFSPAEKEDLQNKFDIINRLLIKHKALSIEELIQFKNQLSNEVSDLSDLEHKLNIIQKEIKAEEQNLLNLAKDIRENRQKIIPKFISKTEQILKKLKMPHTKLKIELQATNNFLRNGMDILEFKISSNQGKSFHDIKKIASGGELSRIMLAVKTILSEYKKLPSIVFDEIDSGISGEVAQNMAEVLKNLARNMQVIVITHSPQIAAAGKKHYKVYKTAQAQEVFTQVKLLNEKERVLEIAEMLEGSSPSSSAQNHAAHLLNPNKLN